MAECYHSYNWQELPLSSSSDVLTPAYIAHQYNYVFGRSSGSISFAVAMELGQKNVLIVRQSECVLVPPPSHTLHWIYNVIQLLSLSPRWIYCAATPEEVGRDALRECRLNYTDRYSFNPRRACLASVGIALKCVCV